VAGQQFDVQVPVVIGDRYVVGCVIGRVGAVEQLRANRLVQLHHFFRLIEREGADKTVPVELLEFCSVNEKSVMSMSAPKRGD
jgi:hypothetical protein